MRIARGSFTPALLVFGLSPVFGQVMPQTFVSVTPCRIADTRTSNGGAGPIPGETYQSFKVVGAAAVDGGTGCNIPSNAAAFSLNVTAVPPSNGSLLFLSVLPATASTPSGPPNSSTLNDPSGTIVANAAIVPSGVNGEVEVYVSSTSDVILDIDGYFVDQTSSTNGTAVGTGAGGSTGSNNTAVGYEALPAGTGGSNTAIGFSALKADTSGNQDTAIGVQALLSNTTGTDNAAVGYRHCTRTQRAHKMLRSDRVRCTRTHRERKTPPSVPVRCTVTRRAQETQRLAWMRCTTAVAPMQTSQSGTKRLSTTRPDP